MVLILRTFLFTPLMVKAASMNTILEDGKRVIVFKIGEPERFDIKVLRERERRFGWNLSNSFTLENTAAGQGKVPDSQYMY
nr:S26 family signal peptidase [Bacillus sp. P14.5]